MESGSHEGRGLRQVTFVSTYMTSRKKEGFYMPQ